MRGGELGFMGRGQLVPEFSNVAFNLTDPTKVSRIVETEFGFHIIQLIERRGDRINCRHILLKPRVSQTDKATAINKLDSITNLIRYEKMTFEQAVLYFSHDKNTVMNSGLMFNEETQTSKYEYQDLPAEVAKVARLGPEFYPQRRADAFCGRKAIPYRNNLCHRVLPQIKVRGIFKGRAPQRRKPGHIALRPRAPHGRALRAVEHPELYGGAVRDDAHIASEGVYFPDYLSFGDASHGRVA